MWLGGQTAREGYDGRDAGIRERLSDELRTDEASRAGDDELHVGCSNLEARDHVGGAAQLSRLYMKASWMS